MKFISTIITGVIVGALGVYFTLDWQEEKLKFAITAPAKFGNINYQNITLQNTGWNPATGIKIYIDHQGISFSNIQSATSLKSLNSEKNGIASLERARRNETIIISLAYEGQPLFGSEVKIVSDRSIATQIDTENNNWLPSLASSVITFFGFLFIFGFLSAIIIPAYKNYSKRAKEAMKNSS